MTSFRSELCLENLRSGEDRREAEARERKCIKSGAQHVDPPTSAPPNRDPTRDTGIPKPEQHHPARMHTTHRTAGIQRRPAGPPGAHHALMANRSLVVSLTDLRPHEPTDRPHEPITYHPNRQT